MTKQHRGVTITLSVEQWCDIQSALSALSWTGLVTDGCQCQQYDRIGDVITAQLAAQSDLPKVPVQLSYSIDCERRSMRSVMDYLNRTRAHIAQAMVEIRDSDQRAGWQHLINADACVRFAQGSWSDEKQTPIP